MSRKKKKSILPYAVILCLLVTGYFVNTFLQKTIFYPAKYVTIIKENAQKNQVDPLLVLALIKAESSFQEKAVSTQGAKGLMQLQDRTAEWCAQKLGMKNFKTEDIFDPSVNIQLGTWYLGSYLMDYYDGDLQLALTAYNAGVGNVDKWLENETLSDGVNLTKIPYHETYTYVNKINSYYERYRQLYDSL